jgi:Ser/Thr protein kinase RdoA (MazF antagonist)
LLCAGSRVIGLLDLDLATYDARAYDLALALFWFAEDPDDATVEPPYRVLPGDRPWIPNAGRARTFNRAYADSLEMPLSQAEIDLLPSLMRVVPLWFAIWYLDLRVTGLEWHPEELSGILSYQHWFAPQAEAYVSSVVC